MRADKRRRPPGSPILGRPPRDPAGERIERYRSDARFRAAVDAMVGMMKQAGLVEQDLIDAQRLAIDFGRIPLAVRERLEREIIERKQREVQAPIQFRRPAQPTAERKETTSHD